MRRLLAPLREQDELLQVWFLVHGYFEIDADIVWETVKRDVPALKPAVERLLVTLGKG